MDAEKLMTEGPSEGKEHHKPELYYDSVLKGSRLVAEKCTKDIISHEYNHVLLCNIKQGHFYYLLPIILKFFLLCGHFIC